MLGSAPIPEPQPLNRRVILLTVCLGAFMATLDTSIVNIALPQIARDFGCSLVQISWVMLIYLLMNVSLLLSSGRLGDLLAPGKLYLLGLVIFTGASALCGFSPSLAWMLAARALQGVGASLMLGMAPKLIALAYGEGERGLALGLFSTAFATGISVGQRPWGESSPPTWAGRLSSSSTCPSAPGFSGWAAGSSRPSRPRRPGAGSPSTFGKP